MASFSLLGEEIGRRGKALYEQTIRQKVETPANIGRMVIIDIETGDYEVDDLGLEASHHLHAKRPDAPLYGIRIGYPDTETLFGCRPCRAMV